MPVILQVPQDPTDMVLQGEQLRMSQEDRALPNFGRMLGGVTDIDQGWPAVMRDEDAFAPMNSFVEINRLSCRRQKSGDLQFRANAGIATPTGAWVWNDWAPLLNQLSFATPRWYVTGVTRDSTGAALGNCRVLVFDYGRFAVGAAQSLVGETISDGSGNYSVEVGEGGQFQVTAYLAGSPNRAGISDIVEATAVG
jgi:hypothetical protein